MSGQIPEKAEPECGENATLLRLLIPICAAFGTKASFPLRSTLARRPLEPLLACMKDHGVSSEYSHDRVRISGRLIAGEYILPGDISSQFVSALLFALPLLRGMSTLRLTTKPVSEPYLRLTEQILRLSGIRLEREGDLWRIPGGQNYRCPDEVTAEADWSGAAFPLCMAAACSSEICVPGLDKNSLQGDRIITELLHPYRQTFDLSGYPDLAPPLAVIAAAQQETTYLNGIARLSAKESDRAEAIPRVIRLLGGQAEHRGDVIMIRGGIPLRGGIIDPDKDHRIAMMAACLTPLCSSSVTIRGAECTEKSAPGFFDSLSATGLKIITGSGKETI